MKGRRKLCEYHTRIFFLFDTHFAAKNAFTKNISNHNHEIWHEFSLTRYTQMIKISKPMKQI